MRASLKLLTFACLGLAAATACPAVEVYVNSGSPAPKPGDRSRMREAPTKEEVLEKRAKAPSPFAPNTVSSVPAGEETKVVVQTQSSLAATALLLNDGKQWTMLPRRSVLRFPDEVKQYIREGKVGDLVSWEQFQNANRAWILSVPMTDANLTGKAPITEEQKEKWTKVRQLLVGTYAGNPVALPLPPAAAVVSEPSVPPTAKP